jgi:hypothetical protein
LMLLKSSGLDWPSCCKRGWSKAGLVWTNWRICWKWGVFLKWLKSIPPAPALPVFCCCCCCWCCWAAANKFKGASSKENLI